MSLPLGEEGDATTVAQCAFSHGETEDGENLRNFNENLPREVVLPGFSDEPFSEGNLLRWGLWDSGDEVEADVSEAVVPGSWKRLPLNASDVSLEIDTMDKELHRRFKAEIEHM